MERRVAIVGAGISGLLACKYALSKGFSPIVFESQPDLGGVWANTLETTRLQNPKQTYQFSDFPWPDSIDGDYPRGSQVQEYTRSYAKHFDVLRHVRFSTKVLSIEYEGVSDSEMEAWSLWNGNGEPFGNKGKWNVLVEDLTTHSQQVIECNFVILGVGRFSDYPNMPKFPTGKGPEVFRGEVIHSQDYSAMNEKDARKLVEGKRVVVVGYRKSALDIAHECATANGKERPCHVLFRRAHWSLPNFSAWGMSLSFLFFNRFAELLLHKPGEGLFLSLLATLLWPLRWLISKFVESWIMYKHPVKKFGLVPEYSFFRSIYGCIFALTPKGFYKSLEEGSIVMKKTPKFSFVKEGITIQGEEEKPIEADLVIFATGFKGDQKLRDIFASSKFKGYITGSPDSTIPLYRKCIHPRIPQLAIIGYAESISNMHTFEMECMWLAELLDGAFKLPEIKDMEMDIAEWDKFIKRYTGDRYRRSCIGGVPIWYSDQLCKDMGVNPKRKKGLIREWFEPYGPLDYSTTK